ncbi:SRPBCC family protein [Lyngbya confervoides]|uniref:SRPBCC family protein n=1 Tax=Lyngbya confervoides BDU141951 TaxID=1574623 RepID=A0ABD4T5A5_9CYAN|nr:SRPBCC family protein [Lyngbya confervoides]MCM1983704.1 SRPBCC family protein [Lyngbya confervoides BDU141951]
MAAYQFVTQWHLAAPIDTVWAAIQHTEDWPQWWPAVVLVEELNPGAADGLGNVRRFVWKMPLFYTLTFETEVVRIQAPVLMEAIAVGEVVGNGVWQLTSTDQGTSVTYTWTVRTTKAWMNVLAAIARPILEWNHNAVMYQGGQGLAKRLNTILFSMDSTAAS